VELVNRHVQNAEDGFDGGLQFAGCQSHSLTLALLDVLAHACHVLIPLYEQDWGQFTGRKTGPGWHPFDA
jgi:hypothetical protein